MGRPSFSPPDKSKGCMCIHNWVWLMLSLVREGKEWTSLVFLQTDNHMHKVDALSCQGGERMGRPSFSPPSKSKGCMCIHDRVRLILSLVRVGKEWAGPVFPHPQTSQGCKNGPAKFFSTQITTCTRLMLYLVRVGIECACPVCPHPLKSHGCMHIHDKGKVDVFTSRGGERMGQPSFSPPR